MLGDNGKVLGKGKNRFNCAIVHDSLYFCTFHFDVLVMVYLCLN